jgi:hypothetical protein
MIRGFRAIGRSAVAVAISAGLVCAAATGASATVLTDGDAPTAHLISAPTTATDPVPIDAPVPPADLPSPEPELPTPELPGDAGLLDGLVSTVTDTLSGLLAAILGLLGGVAPE